MFIELAVFPIMIGFVIAFSLTPMLADWSWSTITSYAYEVPFGAIFVAWIIGTRWVSRARTWQTCWLIMQFHVLVRRCLAKDTQGKQRLPGFACIDLALTGQLFRKGVLFFIRDPAERSYNPVQEILERPASSQIRKVSLPSARMTSG